jgi:AcrR family transcriptional regulator
MSKHPRSSEFGPRRYVLRKRAEQQEDTRRRITEAAVALHQELGPLSTSISAIAARAGVQRLTVYRHFPDEASLLSACTQHYFSLHPPPDPSSWVEVADPEARLRQGLEELYAFWNETEPMMASVLRDYEVDPERAGRGAVTFMGRAQEALAAAWSLPGRRGSVLRASVGHAVDFRTWRSLVLDGGLKDQEAVELMTRLVVAAAQWHKLPRSRTVRTEGPPRSTTRQHR